MKSYLLLIASACLVSLVSCTKDAENSTNISDGTLSTMATSGDLITVRSSGRDNGEWKIKMNDVASRIHSSDLNSFPVNSMIVKEKHDASGVISGYDVMFNSPVDENSSNGWVWNQLDGNGKVIYNAAKRGVSCQNCHANINRNNH